jgi:Asp-tRNA(Asn)/Glu-tRNA(Gln) amidotransferase A subunit family amidase
MCRSVEDCALVLQAISGPDDRDLSVQDVPFNWDASFDVRQLRVGYLKGAFDDTRQTPQSDTNDAAALEQLRALGISLVEISLPEHAPVDRCGNRAGRRDPEVGKRAAVRRHHERPRLFFNPR